MVSHLRKYFVVFLVISFSIVVKAGPLDYGCSDYKFHPVSGGVGGRIMATCVNTAAWHDIGYKKKKRFLRKLKNECKDRGGSGLADDAIFQSCNKSGKHCGRVAATCKK